MSKTNEITVTHTAYGHTYTATLAADRQTVEIDRDGVWAGKGRWDGSSIECAANLVSVDDLDDGADEMDANDASCDVYDALDDAIVADTEIGHYTYGNTPAALPLGDALDDGDQIDGDGLDWAGTVALTGESPDDEEISVSLLTEAWGRHRAGDLVVSGLTCEGHAFHVVPRLLARYRAAEPEYVVAYGDDAEQWGRVASLEEGKALADEELADEPDVTIWLATVYDDSRAGGLPPEATRRNGSWTA